MKKPGSRLDSMHRIVASWFGTGLILGRIRGSHLGSGTVGAAFALPMALLIGHWWGWQGQVVAAVAVSIASVWSSRPFIADEGDAGWICIDEAAGCFVAVIGLPFWPEAIVAWVVFRGADIFKRFAPGVAAAERLPGPIGVTADDIVAGVYGLVVGQVLRTLI
jgi:phosphatidylglycerophosphatase A